MSKKFFGLNFDASMQPGYQTRFKSLDSLFGVRISDKPEKDASAGSEIFKEQGLKEKYKSGLVPETMPSRILRKRGVL